LYSDFEKAVMKALRKTFHAPKLRGCLFHFNQAIYRAIQSAGLKRKYDSNPDFALKLRHLSASALAFVLVDDVVAAFEFLVDSKFFPDEVNDVVEYFEDQWIGRLRRRTSRKPAPYPPSVWNVHNVTLAGLPCTNNAVEGWHRGFDSLTTRYHDSLWETIENFRREETLAAALNEADLAGGPPPEKERRTMYEGRLFAIGRAGII